MVSLDAMHIIWTTVLRVTTLLENFHMSEWIWPITLKPTKSQQCSINFLKSVYDAIEEWTILSGMVP